MELLTKSLLTRPSPVHASKYDQYVQEIMKAATTGDVESIKRIVHQVHAVEPFINARNYLGQTPLMISIINGRSDVVEYLLSRPEINVDAKSSDGQTALMLCCKYSFGGFAAQLLEEHNALINEQDAQGRTALMYACKSKSLSIVQLLLQFKAHVNIKDSKGRRAIFYAIQNTPNLMIISLLTQQGAVLSKSLMNSLDEDDRQALLQLIRQQK